MGVRDDGIYLAVFFPTIDIGHDKFQVYSVSNHGAVTLTSQAVVNKWCGKSTFYVKILFSCKTCDIETSHASLFDIFAGTKICASLSDAYERYYNSILALLTGGKYSKL